MFFLSSANFACTAEIQAAPRGNEATRKWENWGREEAEWRWFWERALNCAPQLLEDLKSLLQNRKKRTAEDGE